MFSVRCFPYSRQGVALIITLILLSVVTFMAITFLALSRRERSAVATVTDTASARLAADAALANAEAQIIANALSTTNPFNFGLLVSTNYINAAGFVNGSSSYTNVSYQYPAGGSLNQNDFLQLLTNLWYSPRPPVFIPNPTNSTLPADFRFYLDLNRNGRYDTNGWVANVDNNNNSLGPNVFQVGDPEWIGILQRPDAPHGPNNPFVALYAFIAVPVGNALDLNYIYNDAKQPDSSMSAGHDGFLRNQGVGSWEINLAAFLTDLNTNQWDPLVNPYVYDTWNGTLYNNGAGFADALSLLKYRYNDTYNNLASVQILYPPGQSVFLNDIDGYSYGPLMYTLSGTNINKPGIVGLPWLGADTTNLTHFFTHQDLFNPAITEIGVTPPGFTERLLAAGTNNSTYDRYTFYRLLSQLGTDSTPESGKMNLNYSNALVLYDIHGLATNISIIPGAETNFVLWRPLDFFTVAADQLLRAYTTQWRNSNPTNFATTFYAVNNFTNLLASQWTTNFLPFGITNIPVLVSNQFVYSSAVNRLLQLAANMYDATTNNTFAQGWNYPTVFRPIFEHDNFGNVFIVGYTTLSSSSGPNTVSGTGDPQLATPHNIIELPSLSANFTPITVANSYVNVYGVPWIIGAKKGFPNFNEFSLESIVWIERKLEITRPSLDAPLSQYVTNQMYFLAISNLLGVECWNSYSSNYTSSSQIHIVAYDNLSMMLTNDEVSGPMPGGAMSVPWSYPMANTVNLLAPAVWLGSAPWTPQQNKPSTPNPSSFHTPFSATVVLPLNLSGVPSTNGIWVYRYQYNNFAPANDPTAATNYVDKGIFPLPQFGLLTTNRLQVFMLDGNHVIDYVQFAGPDSSRNLNAEIADYDPINPDNGMWNTNFVGASSTPWGVYNQIYYVLNPLDKSHLTINDDPTWRNPPGGGTVGQEIASLNAFLNPNHWGSGTDPNTRQSYSTSNLDLSVQVAFPALRTTYQYISWQANDPLVHYLASDLNYNGTEASTLQTGTHQLNYTATNLPANNLGQMNDRYQPWGGILPGTNVVDANPCNPAYKDPLVRQSDNWDFPTNKFPTVGCLGRVHRGTPWQTVYLKATDILLEGGTINNIGTNTWAQWTGDTQLTYGEYFDAVNSAPVRDRLLFDLFTTALNDNATRGTLSVNQDHLAAWSALFSGVVALSNNAPDSSRIRFNSVPQYQNPPPSNSWLIIQPASAAWTNSALGQLVTGINQTRANTNLFPLQAFAHVGDILATPQLTEQSPFLNWNDSLQQTNGISDEMYEWLPQQTMSLLRCTSSPRYVIYSYGQALKPAPNGIYTGSGPFFGMVTNYQVVSEIATRAVVRFGSTVTNIVTSTNDLSSGNPIWFTVPVVTNNNAVIESFNVLPPD